MTERAQISSEIHTGAYRIKPIRITSGIDLVNLAGDTSEGVLKEIEHPRRIVTLHIPIIMVMGNHEHYRRFVPAELALTWSHASNFNVHLLKNSAVVLDSAVAPGAVRFVGTAIVSLLAFSRMPIRRVWIVEAAIQPNQGVAAIEKKYTILALTPVCAHVENESITHPEQRFASNEFRQRFRVNHRMLARHNDLHADSRL